MAQGEFVLVNEHLTAAMQKPPMGWNPVGDHELYVLLADVAAQQRDETMLTMYVPQAETISVRLQHTLYQAIALRALGILDEMHGRMARAEARLKQSYELFQRLETRWQMGRTLFALGQLSATEGRSKEASEYFAQAVNEFESMGARPASERARIFMEGR
jgi:tetratricopeptide (TPR) repeat protein